MVKTRVGRALPPTALPMYSEGVIRSRVSKEMQ